MVRAHLKQTECVARPSGILPSYYFSSRVESQSKPSYNLVQESRVSNDGAREHV